jgi:hypothetical protein
MDDEALSGTSYDNYVGTAGFGRTTVYGTGAIANVWQNVVFAYSWDGGTGGTIAVYVDGTLTANELKSGPWGDLDTEIDNLVIGAYATNRSGGAATDVEKFLSGRLDDFGVFDEALTPGKSIAIHSCGIDNTLRYDLGQMSQLFSGFDAESYVVLGGLKWAKVSGLDSGEPGTLSGSGNEFTLWLTATEGMQSSEYIASSDAPVSEPASLGLLGLALLGLRKRRS